MEAEQSNSS